MAKLIIPLQTGDIVCSKAGHDKGGFAVVLGRVNDDYVMIADGAKRTCETPKLKNQKHLRFVLTNPKIAHSIETARICDVEIRTELAVLLGEKE